MTGKQVGGLVCLLLSGLLAVGAVSSITGGDGPAVGDKTGLGVSRVIGAFLPMVLMLVIGLWLLKKPISTRSSDEPYDDDEDDEEERPRRRRR